jgi:hypothetical protein
MYLSQYPITSGYRTASRPDHEGVDIATPQGTPIPAIDAGSVHFSGWIPAYMAGWPQELIVIIQSSGYFTLYGHLSESLVRPGVKVLKGQQIAKSGNTGYSFGPHLHIEQRVGTKDAGAGIAAYPSRDITPYIKAYGGGEEVTKEQHARVIVQLLGDVLAGDPHYDLNKKAAFEGHVNRLLNAKEPLEERRLAKDFLRDNGWLSQYAALLTYYSGLGRSDAAKVSKAHVDYGTRFEAIMKADMPYFKQLMESQAPLTEQQKADMELGKTVRELVRR